jgi:hypothetical protein
LHPVEKLEMLLVQHYGQQADRFRAAAQGYVDDRLRELFPRIPAQGAVTVAKLLRQHQEALALRMARWSGLRADDTAAIFRKVAERSAALRLRVRREAESRGLMDLASLLTALAMDFAYTGQLLD